MLFLSLLLIQHCFRPLLIKHRA
uniref:Uncharacterized protein n=1 Tax=Arundo donax TaxID=35708 RepID=A0A0A9GKT1_ARUDO